MRLDDSLHDDALLAEVQLTAALMAAANAADEPLSQAEIDQALGLG